MIRLDHENMISRTSTPALVRPITVPSHMPAYGGVGMAVIHGSVVHYPILHRTVVCRRVAHRPIEHRCMVHGRVMHILVVHILVAVDLSELTFTDMYLPRIFEKRHGGCWLLCGMREAEGRAFVAWR